MKTTKRTWIKISAAGIAFIPIFLAALVRLGIVPDTLLGTWWMIFNFPALGLTYSVKTAFHLGQSASLVWLIFWLLSWSSFLAWVFWKIAGTFLGEDEPEFETHPESAKFDWNGFWVRFVCGFAIGFLVGWRLVRNSTGKSTVLTAMIVTGLFCGLAYGLYRPNFWSRP